MMTNNIWLVVSPSLLPEAIDLPPFLRISQLAIHQKPKRRSYKNIILGQNKTKSKVPNIEWKVMIFSLNWTSLQASLN
jgi:hypothetical protein